MISVRYVLAYEVVTRYGLVQLTEEEPVLVAEDRGKIIFHCLPGPFTPEGIAALNVAAAQVIAGGQWFQLWRGEIISLDSPQTDDRGADAGLHRGSLVDQAAGPRHR